MRNMRQIFMILLVSVLTFFIVNITNFPEDALSNDKVSSTTETNWGLHTTTFTTPEGKIKVNFPDDMAAGDTISGTVIAEPAGATLDERERNSDELNGYVVEVEKTKTPVIGKVLKWTVPAALVGGATYIILRDKDGKEVTRSEVPVIPTPPFEKPPTTPSSTDYSLPGVGQAGRPTQIVGIFDGDSNTTTVEIGGRNTRILAESPRKTIFESPRDLIGPTEIKLKEGNVETRREFNNLRVSLTSPKQTLLRGEQTTVTTKVEGLKGLPSQSYPIPIEIINLSPKSVRFVEVPGTVIDHSITHDAVSAEGSYSFETGIQGIQPGPFTIATYLTTLLRGDWLCCSYSCTNAKGKKKRVQWCKDVKVGAKCPGAATYAGCVCDTGRTIGGPPCDPGKCSNVIPHCG